MLPSLRPGLILYKPGSDKSAALARFAVDLMQRGWKVGGVVLDTVFEGEERIGFDLVELDTNERVPLSRRTTTGIQVGEWQLDEIAIELGARAIARARERGFDLIVIDKFGPLEGRGLGFMREIECALESGIPTLAAARAEFLEDWDLRVPQRAELLRPESSDLWRWWGPDRMMEELARAVPDVPCAGITVGFNWTLVEGPDGSGLATTPNKGSGGCRTIAETGSLAQRSLAELARMALSVNPYERAIGIAAINASTNRRDMIGPSGDGLSTDPDGQNGHTVIIGRFPQLEEKVPGAIVLERNPGPDDLPAEAARLVIPGCSRLIVTASALVNGTLPSLLEMAEGAEVSLVGRGTPLAQGLHAYGIDRLAGFIVDKPDGARAVVAEGGGARQLKPFGRNVVLDARQTQSTHDHSALQAIRSTPS